MTTLKVPAVSMVAACAALLTLAFASPVLAADGKVYASSSCAPYSSGSGDILTSSIGYIRNTSNASSALVMCPVVKDVVNGTNASYLRVSFTKTSSTGLYCGFYGRTHSGGGSSLKSSWDFAGAGTRTMTFNNLGGYGSGTYELYCILPPGAKLHSYRLDES